MVKLPDGFVATWFTGYFWNIIEQRLYSIKPSGVLKPMKLTQPDYFNHWDGPGYRVSNNGRRRTMMVSRLKKLVPTNTEIPVMETKK